MQKEERNTQARKIALKILKNEKLRNTLKIANPYNMLIHTNIHISKIMYFELCYFVNKRVYFWKNVIWLKQIKSNYTKLGTLYKCIAYVTRISSEKKIFIRKIYHLIVHIIVIYKKYLCYSTIKDLSWQFSWCSSREQNTSLTWIQIEAIIPWSIDLKYLYAIVVIIKVNKNLV